MYSFLRYSLYRGSGERRSRCRRHDGEGEDDKGAAAGEGGGEYGGLGAGESGSTREEGDREGYDGKFQLFTTLLFSFHIFISMNNLSIFLNMYSFLRYILYRGSGERRGRCRRRRWRRRR